MSGDSDLKKQAYSGIEIHGLIENHNPEVEKQQYVPFEVAEKLQTENQEALKFYKEAGIKLLETVSKQMDKIQILEKRIADAQKILDMLGSERELVYRKFEIDSPIGSQIKEFSAVSWDYLEKFEKRLREVLAGDEK